MHKLDYARHMSQTFTLMGVLDLFQSQAMASRDRKDINYAIRVAHTRICELSDAGPFGKLASCWDPEID